MNEEDATSAQINTVIRILLSREDLVEPVANISAEIGFKLEDLLPRSLDDFGNKKTPSIIKTLRLRNFELKRTKRMVKVLKELKRRRILFISPDELQESRRPGPSPFKSLSPLHRTSQKDSDHNKQVYENAAVNYLIDISKRAKKIIQKEKSHQVALEKLKDKLELKKLEFTKREEERLEARRRREKESEELELAKINRKVPYVHLTSRSASHEPSIISPKRLTFDLDEDKVEDKLKLILGKLNEGSKRATLAKHEKSMTAAKLSDSQKVTLCKKKIDREDEKKMYFLKRSINNKINNSEQERRKIINMSTSKLSLSHDLKKKKLELYKKNLRLQIQNQKEKISEREKMITERLGKLKEAKDLELSVCVEKRNIKKLNQLEKAKEDDFFSNKKKQHLFNRLFESTNSISSPKSVTNKLNTQLMQDSFASTKLYSSKRIAQIRSKALNLK